MKSEVSGYLTTGACMGQRHTTSYVRLFSEQRIHLLAYMVKIL